VEFGAVALQNLSEYAIHILPLYQNARVQKSRGHARQKLVWIDYFTAH